MLLHDDLKDLDDDLSVVQGHDANLFFSDDGPEADNPVFVMLAFSSAC